MRVSVIIGLLTLLGGCQEQIRLGVEQTVSTIPDILTDDVVNNLLNIRNDRYAPIAQVSLKESVSTAVNGFNYGAAPSIAFRAIAATGLSLTANNSLNENWSADPANGSLDYYRLQLLFRYAIQGDINHTESFKPTKEKILGAGMPNPKDLAKLKKAFSFLDNLPPGPFAVVDRHCPGRGKSYLGTLNPNWVCFRATPDLSGEEVAHLLVLWAIAIPDMSSAINQPGASSKGGSNLTVAAPTR